MGEELARRDLADPVVLGLPRGGVPVAFEVAVALDAPLDVLVVRKLGVPWQPELGMGAIGEGDVLVVSDDVVRAAGVDPSQFDRVVERERAAVAARAARLRHGVPPLPLAGRTAVIVDDGLATGGTARAAVAVSRARAPPAWWWPCRSPRARRSSCSLARPTTSSAWRHLRHFVAVGAWYTNFDQTSDAEVASLLAEASRR